MNIKLLLTLIALALFSSGCTDKSETTEKTATASTTEHQEKDSHGHDETAAHPDDDQESKHGHDEKAGAHGDEHEEEAGVVTLTAEQMKAAGIIVSSVSPEEVATIIRAPGEVMLNAYQTVKVTPRIPAQVIDRHARLGDYVEKGQSLVTLSSVEMAEAQGQLLIAGREWERVKKLGRNVVSGKRYITARVEYEKAYANAKAFGMSEPEIRDLLALKRSADGSFKLVARQAGRILHDKFVTGERVEAGYELMVISNEETMWVEARVTPNIADQIEVDSPAEILLNGQRLPAKVIQLHHTLDETTRTKAVRLEVPNKDDLLHAGMFVTTFIASSNKSKALQVPEAAVLRSPDGDWQVLVEQDEAGEFRGVEVKVIQIINGMAIIEGIRPGTRVVTQGAFFVQSELAKGGFEIHNH